MYQVCGTPGPPSRSILPSLPSLLHATCAGRKSAMLPCRAPAPPPLPPRWSHGLISQDAADEVKKVCNFRQGCGRGGCWVQGGRRR